MAGMQTLVEVTLTSWTAARCRRCAQRLHRSATRDPAPPGWNGTLNRLTERLDPRGSERR